MHRLQLSIVVPCYNEAETLPLLHQRVSATAHAVVGDDHEIVLINDGSRDDSWRIMQQLAAADPRVVAINLSRNHGHQLALTAGLDLSSGARVGLTGFLAGVARQVAASGVTINFLLPGLFATRRLEGVNRFAADAAGITPDEAERRNRERIPARRFGDPAEFGAACAFLCSAQAGYITGQSLLIDGGSYTGIM